MVLFESFQLKVVVDATNLNVLTFMPRLLLFNSLVSKCVKLNV